MQILEFVSSERRSIDAVDLFDRSLDVFLIQQAFAT